MTMPIPVEHPIDAHPMLLTGNVAERRFVTPAGAQAGADAVVHGVAATAGTAGERITVYTAGRVLVEAGAAVSVGAVIKSDAQGRAIPWATSGARVGVALSAATAAGQMITLYLRPALA